MVSTVIAHDLNFVSSDFSNYASLCCCDNVTSIDVWDVDLWYRWLKEQGPALASLGPLVQAVGARVRSQFDRPWRADEARQGRLVVIAEHDDINPDAIRKVLEG